MLYKNDFKPATAYAGADMSADNARYTKNNSATLMSADDDDFGNFASGTTNEKPKRKPQSKSYEPRPSKAPKKRSIMPFVFAGIAVVALVIIIALVVAIFNIPKSSSQISDNVYFTYVDENNEYHITVNGEKIEKTFKNEIKLIPADDNSFAYVLEKVENDDVTGNSGIRMHILNGKKLKSSGGLADECLAFAGTKPGIIYKYRTTFGRYTGDTEDPITKESTADNFIISDDAKTVVYTAASRQDEDKNILKYFQGSGSEDMQMGFTPVAISPDGRYIYGTADVSGSFYYIDAKAKEIKPKAITNQTYGTFGGITEMNVDGDEIIFYMTTSKGIVSFYYAIKDKAPTTLAQGIFTSVHADEALLAPNSFLGTYFEVQTTSISYDEDGEPEIDEDGDFSTYFLAKNKGAIKVADTTGKFSQDGKFFYYIDESSQLVRVPLSSTDYEKNIETVCGYITEFALTQKGDVYMFYAAGDDEDEPAFLYYWDSSTKQRTKISNYADNDSMRICANTLYFSETLSDSESGDLATIVYISTDGSEQAPAEFKSVKLDKAPTVDMGVGKRGYAYVLNEDGNYSLFYTSNGKQFDLISDSCTIPNADSAGAGNAAIG